MRFRFLIPLIVLAPVLGQAANLFLYTVNFDAVPGGYNATSVSYLSEGLLGSNMTVLPAQTTILSLPGAGATPFPGLGFGDVSESSFSFAFNLGGSLQWLLTGDTNTIAGPGVYPILGGQTQSGLSNYVASGTVDVEELSTPPAIFRYTETWAATALSDTTVYTYDSPVFIAGLLPLDGSDVHTVTPPAPGSFPSGFLFAVGNSIGEANYDGLDGSEFFFTGSVNTPVEVPGTYAFDTADFEYFSSSQVETDFPNETGSFSIEVIPTPEPGTVGLLVAGLLVVGGGVRRRKT